MPVLVTVPSGCSLCLIAETRRRRLGWTSVQALLCVRCVAVQSVMQCSAVQCSAVQCRWVTMRMLLLLLGASLCQGFSDDLEEFDRMMSEPRDRWGH